MRETPYPNPGNVWDGGIFLPGWHCRAENCGVFNGELVRQVRGVEVKETHTECRSCGRPRGWADNPDLDDPGERDCRTFLGNPQPVLPYPKHLWRGDGDGRCIRCGAHAIRGVFGERLKAARAQVAP